MAHMVDCYSPLDASELTRLMSSGIDTFGRYLGRKSCGFSKGMTPDEKTLITSRKGRIVSVFERVNNNPAYFTFDQGIRDGAAALEDALWLGQPEGTDIYFPVDYDAQPAHLSAILSYYQGVQRSIGNKYVVCRYGGFFVMENVNVGRGWQTAAWSYGKVSKNAMIYQRGIDTTLAGVSVDIDDISGNVGVWPMTYPAEKVEFNGQPRLGVAVNGDTYPIWTLAQDAGANITKAAFGDVEIDGKKVRQVTQDGNTYVHYADIPGIHPVALPGGGFNFVNAPKTAPATKPTPAPAATPGMTVSLTKTDGTQQQIDGVKEINVK